jgi:hypothetical protein
MPAIVPSYKSPMIELNGRAIQTFIYSVTVLDHLANQHS